MRKERVLVLLVIISFICLKVHSSDLLIDYFLPEVERSGDKKVIEIYREYISIYLEIRKNIEKNDNKSAFSFIDQYVIQKTEYLKKDLPRRERFYLSRFISTSLYIRALILFPLNRSEAVELFYYAFLLIHEEYQKLNEDIIITDFIELFSPILRLGSPEQELDRFRQGILPPSFISHIQDVEKEIDDAGRTTNDSFEIIPQVLPEDTDKLMDLFQGFRYFNYLKPIERTLLITYNPKNRKALSYIKELQKASGLRIRKQKDTSYDFFQMYARIDPEFAQQIFRKYYEKRS